MISFSFLAVCVFIFFAYAMIRDMDYDTVGSLEMDIELPKGAIILDTETTGLGNNAEIVEISIIDLNGNILLNTLIKPKDRIPPEVIAIHGITNDAVRIAPSWLDADLKVAKILQSAPIILIYNADFDLRMIRQTQDKYGLPHYKNIEKKTECIMHFCSQQALDETGYKRRSLNFMAKHRGVRIIGTPHRALTDCLTVKSILDTYMV